jgi:AraC family transcriptional regulator of arabinose operon
MWQPVRSPHQDDAFRHLLTQLSIHLIAANYDKVGADWKRDEHVLGYNRMFYILDGEGYVEVDGTRYYPAPGQLLVMPAGTRQAYSSVNDNGFTKYWCYFKAKIGDADLFRMFDFPVSIEMKDKGRTAQLFQQLVFHFQQRRRTSSLMIKASMLELLTHFIDHALEDFPPQSRNEKTEKISMILNYIEQHLAERITVEQLAQLAHYHPNYFIRYFHNILGASPVQYMKHLRMEKAKTLLLSTSLPVSEIAREVGIEHSNFTPMFKKHTGFLPSAFRDIVKP